VSVVCQTPHERHLPLPLRTTSPNALLPTDVLISKREERREKRKERRSSEDDTFVKSSLFELFDLSFKHTSAISGLRVVEGSNGSPVLRFNASFLINSFNLAAIELYASSGEID
jgi:hypothetical protein